MKKTVRRILLVFVLAAMVGAAADQRNTICEKTCVAAVTAYLQEQKTAPDGAKTIPPDTDPETGRVIRVYVDDPHAIDRLISYFMNVTEVRRVKRIPELAYPRVYIGDRLLGNNETLYYSEENQILAFSLNETDSLAFLLDLTENGSLYPEVREAFTGGVIRQLQNEIDFSDQDILSFTNGCLESIDIKTQETAEALFRCIRACVQIHDLTDVYLEPMALPVKINGKGAGTFDMFFATYQETGQFVCFSFAPEDAQAFRNYVAALK